jgi:protein-S-isoprenylcysteine O-methyltransferase Ste14
MKTKLQPPAYFFASLILLVGLHFTLPLMRLIVSPYRYLGAILIVFGVFLNLWTDSLFKKRETTVKPYEMPSHLEVSGPFRITRHPMYLGMVSILLGIAVALGSLVPMIVPVLFVIVAEVMFIPFEEENLKQTFKEEYLDYKRKVRRWI